MRISDWSSDVCSSDLGDDILSIARELPDHRRRRPGNRLQRLGEDLAYTGGLVPGQQFQRLLDEASRLFLSAAPLRSRQRGDLGGKPGAYCLDGIAHQDEVGLVWRQDPERDGEGQGVTVGLDLGGGRKPKK